MLNTYELLSLCELNEADLEILFNCVGYFHSIEISVWITIHVCVSLVLKRRFYYKTPSWGGDVQQSLRDEQHVDKTLPSLWVSPGSQSRPELWILLTLRLLQLLGLQPHSVSLHRGQQDQEDLRGLHLRQSFLSVDQFGWLLLLLIIDLF